MALYSKNNLKTPLGEKIKLGIAAVLIIFFIMQVYGGIQLLQANNEELPELSAEAMETMNLGTRFKGETDSVVFSYMGSDVLNEVPVSYYLIKTPNGKLLTLRTEVGSSMDAKLAKALGNKGTKVAFRGYVKEMKDSTHKLLSLQYVAANGKAITGVEGTLHDSLICQIVDVTEPQAKMKEEYVTVTFLGAALLALIIFLLLKKTVKNAYETIAVEKGWKTPPAQVKQDDLTFELQGMYDENARNGEYFYVNTAFDQREQHEHFGEWKPVAERRAEMAAAAQQAVAPKAEPESSAVLTVKDIKRKKREEARAKRKQQQMARGEQLRKAFFSPLLGEDIYPRDTQEDTIAAAEPQNDTDFFYSEGASEEGTFYVDLSDEGTSAPKTLSDRSKRY